jgi:hypothetical protein
VNGAVREDSKPESNKCSTKYSEIANMVETTELFGAPVNFSLGPATFKLRRHPKANSSSHGEEMLELRGDTDYTEYCVTTAFAFFPDAQLESSLGCAEFLGINGFGPHIGMSQNIPHGFVWRIGIRRQLELMGVDHLDYVVLTLIGSELNQKNILLTSAKVIYSNE